MGKKTSVQSFSADFLSGGIDFKLEQKPWAEKNPARFSDWLEENKLSPDAGSIFLAYEQFKSQCDSDGDLSVIFNARLSDITAAYSIRSSYGVFSTDIKFVEETRKEFLKFEFDTEKTIDFGTITSAVWNGEVRNTAGNILTNHPVNFANRMAKSSIPILGVLEITIFEQYYQHTLIITPRTPTVDQQNSEDSIVDQLYAATVWMFCDNRIDIKDVEMPENFGTCTGGFGGTEFPDDPDDPEDAEYMVTFEAFDICTGKILPDATFVVSGKSVSAGETMTLSSGDYRPIVWADGYTQNNLDTVPDNDQFTLPRVGK